MEISYQQPGGSKEIQNERLVQESKMAGNQIMPEPNKFQMDQTTMLARLNKIAVIAGRIGYDREDAMNKLPSHVPIPLRFEKYGRRFLCKKCGHRGWTRVDVLKDLGEGGKKMRFIHFLIFPICTVQALCELCKETPCRKDISDRVHLCPECETELARWSYWLPATEVTPQELAEALRMEKDPEGYPRVYFY